MRPRIRASAVSWSVRVSVLARPLRHDVRTVQMEAERQRRKQLLDTEVRSHAHFALWKSAAYNAAQANVNVADGTKRQSVLISAGQAQVVINEAEAQRARAVLETTALAEQVSALASALAGVGIEVSSDHRTRALETLVELQRLQQLRAIATGHGNSTYFFDAEKSGGVGMRLYVVRALAFTSERS